MNKYVKTPEILTLQELYENNYVLTPSKYTRLEDKYKRNLFPLSSLCVESKTKLSIKKKNAYFYTEIGDVDNSTGIISSNKFFGINLPAENPKACQQNDILISTVRTYLNGIGLVTSHNINQCCTPAFLVIRNVTDSITKEYLLALLKSDFFIEQVEGFQTRGMYPRLDKDVMNKILIPVPCNKNEIKFITMLQRAILNKSILIKKRHEIILKEIESELKNNQKAGEFHYTLPTFSEVNTTTRLDTGIYSEVYKKNIHLIENYKNGYFKIEESEIESGCTPEVRFIDDNPKLKYQWITPSVCSDYGTINECRINMRETNNINKDSILIINRTSRGGYGEYVGITSYYDYNELGAGQHNQGIYRVSSYTNTKLLFILCCLNCDIYRKICASLSVGSKMKEIKAKHISSIPFPQFSETKQNEIIKLFHNAEIKYESSTFHLDNFLKKDSEFNQKAGIYDLDKSIKQLKVILNNAIDKIVNNEKVSIDFSNKA